MNIRRMAVLIVVLGLSFILKVTPARADECPCDGVCYTLDGCDQSYTDSNDLANCYGEVMGQAAAECINSIWNDN